MDKKTNMEELVREAYEKGSFTGTWLYSENGEIVSKGAVGFLDPEERIPIKEDTIFQLASVTKQFTAASVMLLVRKDFLCLEDEVTKFFPEIPYPGVTIRHLLTHTGGVPDYFDDGDWFTNLWKEEHRVPGNSEIVRFLCETELKPYFAPGENYQYSNTGFNLLAEIVERLSGVPFEEFLKKNIFEPAGMTNTRAFHTRRDGIPFENYARALVLEDGRFVPDADSDEYGEVTAFDGLNGDDYVYTNIFDMLRWDQALREGTVLTREEQMKMYTPVKLLSGEPYADEDGDGYGFGWHVNQDPALGLTVCHSGGMPGVHTFYERFVDADRVLVILCSREELDIRAHNALFDGLRDIARDNEPKPIRTIEEIAVQDPDRSEWDSFCGKYDASAEEGLLLEEVFRKGENLYAVLWDTDSEKRKTAQLYPLSENRFGLKWDSDEIVFSEAGVAFGGEPCRKLS